MRSVHLKAEDKLAQMLGIIQGRMRDDGERSGERSGRLRSLRLDPDDLARMGAGMGLNDAEAAELFRGLVRGNYVRLRGRFREGVTGLSAPAYVAGLTDRGLHELERGAGRHGPTRGGPEP